MVNNMLLYAFSSSEIECQVFSPQLNELGTEIACFFFRFLAQGEPKVRTRKRGAISRRQKTETRTRTMNRSSRQEGTPLILVEILDIFISP